MVILLLGYILNNIMHALEIEQLSKIYSNGVHAVKGINLTVDEGDFFALLGANGAGKSTTIGLITTLVNKTNGKIKVYGYDLDRQTTLAKSCLGLVPQEINLSIFETSEQILLSQAGYYGVPSSIARPRVEQLLDQLGLTDKKNSIVRHLSGGMKRRLMIARALVHQPKVLILDEPTAGVDIEIRRSIWNFLNQLNAQGTTIILTTHYLEEAEQLCKNIAIIDKGSIIKHTSIKALLNNFNHQTFVFNLKQPLTELPELSGFKTHLIDAHTLELQVSSSLTLNEVFQLLSQKDIQVHSMRNKTNRLEELFLDLIKNDY
jgi:ABC-2 type transport system ATP-binding protein